MPASHIVSRQLLVAPAEVARRLGLARGDTALRLQRVRSLSGQPCVYEEIWLPPALFAGLAEGDAASLGRPALPHVCRALRRARGPRGR